MRRSSAPLAALVAVLVPFAAVPLAYGRSLRTEVARIQEGSNVVNVPVTTFGELLVKLAPMSQVLPSSTPGWAMSWDPSTQEFVRFDAPAGPVFTERATTVGRGALLFNATYQDLNFQRLEGHSLHGPVHICVGGRAENGDCIGGLPVDVRSFLMYQRLLVFGFTYGLFDGVDLAATLPLTHTRVTGHGYEITPDSGPPPPSSDTDSGAGDLLLRAKWRATTVADTALALELGLRLPSGSPEDFRGAGSVGVIPTAVLSRAFGPAAFDVELGVDADGSNMDATRARYRVGGTVNVLPWLCGTAELVGSSGFASVHVPPIHLRYSDFTDSFDVPRTDIVDADFALHVTLLGHFSGFAGVGVPLTSDGLRPNLVPLFGVTAAF